MMAYGPLLAASNTPIENWYGRPAAVEYVIWAPELRIDVAVADAAERGAGAGARAALAGAADAEQRLVGQDVLALEEAQLAADEQLAPAAADGQEHLTHVDLGAEAVVDAGGAVDLRREAEMHAEIGVAFLALGIEHRKRRQQAGR